MMIREYQPKDGKVRIAPMIPAYTREQWRYGSGLIVTHGIHPILAHCSLVAAADNRIIGFGMPKEWAIWIGHMLSLSSAGGNTLAAVGFYVPPMAEKTLRGRIF